MGLVVVDAGVALSLLVAPMESYINSSDLSFKLGVGGGCYVEKHLRMFSITFMVTLTPVIIIQNRKWGSI